MVSVKTRKLRHRKRRFEKRRFETLDHTVDARGEVIGAVVDCLKDKTHTLQVSVDLYRALLKTCEHQFSRVEEAMRND